MQYKFKCIDNGLVECTDINNDEVLLLTINEAKMLGFVQFTYKNEPISYAAFAKLISKDPNAVSIIIHKNAYTTGEQVIEHYKNHNSYKYINFDLKKLANVLNRTPDDIRTRIKRYNFKTEQEVINFYNSLDSKICNNFTYKGEHISITKFAEIIGRKSAQIGNIIRQFGYVTGEQVIEHCKNHSKCYDYNNVDIKQLAVMFNKKEESIKSTIRKFNFTTADEVINYYNELNSKPVNNLTYQGKPTTIHELARLLGKQVNTVWKVIKQNNYTTGEQVIEHLSRSCYDNRKDITYNGVAMSIKSFATIIGKNSHSVSNIKCKYKYTTGEQIVEHYRKKGLL